MKRVVAFLHCQWFKPKSIESIKRMYARNGDTPEKRARLNSILLFYKSVSGRRLKAVFGEDLCHHITWEEITKEVGDHPSFSPPADVKHVKAVLKFFKPEVVITFGRPAETAIKALHLDVPVIHAPHPAARSYTTLNDLHVANLRLRKLIK